ncbi:flavin reductase family protein [Polaromonas sp. C04]|uniref:flavin reductase family protein n=1 Tax=Polaromonas sp. C04 TaxID=1945857 RepID=UPI000984396C|nr:flavin reductase family protein [Polaromonas sp. C04]OOG53221.1 hypothetical protein B0E49_12255 [Polaromonas sp. C04]
MSIPNTLPLGTDTPKPQAATQPLDPANLRQFAGQFPTGVAVVTAYDGTDRLHGLTLNAVTSVSLNPPLYLVCLSNTSNTLNAIMENRMFGINFLSEGQQAVSRVFASKSDNKFDSIPYLRGHERVPLLQDAVATAVCRVEDVFPGGDHQIVVGRLESYDIAGGHPLMFHKGQYLDRRDSLPSDGIR